MMPAAAIQSLQTASRFDLAVGGIGFNGVLRRDSIPSTFAARRTLRRISPQRPPPSSSGFSIIEASCSSIQWTRWRACSWRRALVLSGDTVKAKSAYSDLLTLWKNADPDIPVVKEARAEYAKLL